MTLMAPLTHDAFLGGKLYLWQPSRGYRAATDPVFLAASVPVEPGQSVLDLGCGAGCAVLCLATRVNGLSLTGVEISPDMAELARRNGDENGHALEVVEGDVRNMPVELRERTFDHVICNPPYFPASGVASPDQLRDRARRDGRGELGAWIDAGLRRLRYRGMLSVIHLTGRLPEILHAVHGRAGSVRICPLAARPDRPAERVIVQCLKGGRAPAELCPPFVVHGPGPHVDGPDTFSPMASAVLRSGEALKI